MTWLFSKAMMDEQSDKNMDPMVLSENVEYAESFLVLQTKAIRRNIARTNADSHPFQDGILKHA